MRLAVLQNKKIKEEVNRKTQKELKVIEGLKKLQGEKSKVKNVEVEIQQHKEEDEVQLPPETEYQQAEETEPQSPTKTPKKKEETEEERKNEKRKQKKNALRKNRPSKAVTKPDKSILEIFSKNVKPNHHLPKRRNQLPRVPLDKSISEIF